MNPWLALVLISLAVMKTVEFVKELMPWALQPWTKSLASLLLSIGLAIGLAPSWSWKWTAALALAASGGSALVHEVRSYLLLRGDEAKTTVITRVGSNRRVRL